VVLGVLGGGGPLVDDALGPAPRLGDDVQQHDGREGCYQNHDRDHGESVGVSGVSGMGRWSIPTGRWVPY
jgi:hypothetical protein